MWRWMCWFWQWRPLSKRSPSNYRWFAPTTKRLDLYARLYAYTTQYSIQIYIEFVSTSISFNLVRFRLLNWLLKSVKSSTLQRLIGFSAFADNLFIFEIRNITSVEISACAFKIKVLWISDEIYINIFFFSNRAIFSRAESSRTNKK